MPRVAGRLVFDRNRTASYSSSMPGIANVPIVLQNLVTKSTLAVFTGSDGSYQFDNVPSGNYQVVEYYGFLSVVTSPGNFDDAFTNEILNGGITPPLSYVNNPPQSATNLDCTTRNTHLITVTTVNLTDNFLNGPVKYTPIETIIDNNVVILPENLISLADCGTFGYFPAGTAGNTGANPNPYPEIVTNFRFVQPNPSVVTPSDGEYTIQNLMNNSHGNVVGTWWRISDHTTGNEMGRMMVVNGYNPGAIIYGETVNVLSHTYYLFSAWILNLCFQSGYADPALGVKISNELGEVLYSASLGVLIAKNTYCPEWRQIGTALYSGENTVLIVQFISEGPAATGNDYVLDDIKFNPLIITPFTPVKSADVDTLNVNEVVTYTITLENTGANPLTEVSFVDVVPDGLTFIPGSVEINGIIDLIANPNEGFSVPDIPGGETLVVSFAAVATSVPTINPTINNARVIYSYSPVQGGISSIYDESSNDVLVYIVNADLAITKTADVTSVSPGDEIIYTIHITNNGPDDAQNVTLKDESIIGLSDIKYSINNGLTWLPWTGTYSLESLVNDESLTIFIKGSVEDDAPDVIINTATISSDTLDPNLDNNTATVTTSVNFSADISVVKTPHSSQVVYGDRLVYTVVITNDGPSVAENVVLSDILPYNFENPLFSVDNITWVPWVGPYSVGSLSKGEHKILYIEGIIGFSESEKVVNTVIVESDTPDPDLSNNVSTATVIFATGADILVTKISSPKPVIVGNQLVYTITVKNDGPEIAENVIVTDDVTGFLINPEFSLEGSSWNTWISPYSIGNLNPEEEKIILLRGTVPIDATGNITNTVTVLSDTPDPNLDNNTSTEITPILPIGEYADLAVIKTANQQTAWPCDIVIYTITIINNGPEIAENVILEDNVPNSLYHVRYSLDNGQTWRRWKSTINLNNLDSGSEIVVLIKGVVKNRVFESIVNSASVTSDTPDPYLDNNTSINIIDIIK